jgi:hypothetical protein
VNLPASPETAPTSTVTGPPFVHAHAVTTKASHFSDVLTESRCGSLDAAEREYFERLERNPSYVHTIRTADGKLVR